MRNLPHLSVSSIIAAFHTTSPIHYVTFDRKWDATAQGVKRLFLWAFISISIPFPAIQYSYVCEFYFIVQKNRIDFGTQTKKNLKTICLIFPCNVMQYEALSRQLMQLCVGICCLSVVFKMYCSSGSFLFCLYTTCQHLGYACWRVWKDSSLFQEAAVLASVYDPDLKLFWLLLSKVITQLTCFLDQSPVLITNWAHIQLRTTSF